MSDALLLSLLNGAFEQPPWHAFLDRLRVETHAGYASLIFRAPAPARASLVHLYSGRAAPLAIERLYRESLHDRDPVPYHVLEDGKVYALGDLLDPASVRHAAYRRAMLEPSGMLFARLMRIIEPTGMNVWLTIARGADDFGDADDAMLDALAPYLRVALRGFAALERERFAASVSGEAIARLNYGWLTLDAAGHILETDAGAARLLDHSGIVRRDPAGRLAGGGGVLAGQIADAVAAMTADPGRPRAMVLSREPWLDMLLVSATRRPVGSGPSPALIAYVHGDGWSSADRCDQLAELFGLLPSEARLTLALSRGLSMAEAAGELGLTVDTARTYSKRIFAKMGARGQPDLVRFVHRSVLALA